jgi:hypothetical protein
MVLVGGLHVERFRLAGAAAALSAALIAPGARAGDAPDTPDKDAQAARTEQVRTLIRPHCGSCHTGSLPSAKPKAVAVFDLDTREFQARMTRAQLDAFIGRLSGKLDDAGQAVVRVFVEVEKTRQPVKQADRESPTRRNLSHRRPVRITL